MNKRLIATVAVVFILTAGGYGWHQYHTPEAYITRGHILQMQGHFKEAVPQYQEAVYLQPKDAQTHSFLGDALMSYNYALVRPPVGKMLMVDGNAPPKEQLHQAIIEYSIAVQLDPHDMGYHFSLAGALDNTGDTRAALVQWREVLALLPQTPTRMVAVGVQTDNAQTLSDVYSSLASDLALTGALTEADQDYKAALHWEPTYDYRRLEYATFLNQHGKRSEARTQWQKIVTGNGYEVSSAKAMLAKYPEQI